jgi:arginyl-tRNA synthetase
MLNPAFQDAKTHLADLLSAALALVAPGHAAPGIVFDRPKQTQHGDYACNIALQLAKALGSKPRDIAQKIVSVLPVSPILDRAEIAGPGFINFFLKRSYKQQIVNRVLGAGANYGRSVIGLGTKIQIEFVSANPTGPLHVGHGRGAAYGASLANVLAAAGYEVSREYYINDAGRQMDILALSTWLRYLEAHNEQVPFPPNAYRGDYVRDMAHHLREQYGTKFVRKAHEVLTGLPPLPTTENVDASASAQRETHLDALITKAKTLLGSDYSTVHQLVLLKQLGDCRNDLNEFGVDFDQWFSERSLFDTGMVERAVASLEQRGHIYVQDGAKWFRSSNFSDEKDRVVRRENGQFTYFASDIAYHLNKFERGFDQLVDVWGADHHGYIPRVKSALTALNMDARKLTVALVQFAVLYRNGEKVQMSTRSGEFVTLRELRGEVGNDAARFFYVLRKGDQHLDFDLDLAKSRTNENPVYYIQYAHARICSVHGQWGGTRSELLEADPALLDSDHELALLQKLDAYPEVVELAARELAPHLIAFYLKDLAAAFHGYYNATRFLVDAHPVRIARLALATAVQQILQNALALLGVSAPEKM